MKAFGNHKCKYEILVIEKKRIQFSAEVDTFKKKKSMSNARFSSYSDLFIRIITLGRTNLQGEL